MNDLLKDIKSYASMVKDGLEFRRMAYGSTSDKSYLELLYDTGSYGEFLTYKALRPFEKLGAKFLFNAYLPKKDGTTCEIDLMMLSVKGIFVFESKNYGGWIFGSEDDQVWCQSLPGPKGKPRKEFFMNPVIQNGMHIYCLEQVLHPGIPTWSAIVFSERCALKKMNIHSDNILVVKREQLYDTIQRVWDAHPDPMTSEDVDNFFRILQPFTRVSEEVKVKHIADLKEKYGE